MTDSQFQVLVYQTKDGRRPFDEWLINLKDRSARARIRSRINRLRQGNFGDCHPVGTAVSELRIDYGPGYRIYFGKVGLQIVLLLYGGDKRKQSPDIAQAEAFWSDYKARTKKEAKS